MQLNIHIYLYNKASHEAEPIEIYLVQVTSNNTTLNRLPGCSRSEWAVESGLLNHTGTRC